MSKNIKFKYLYRDAGNYKSWGEVIFTNTEDFSLDQIEKRMKQAFEQEILFTADQINIDELYFETFNDDDHCYHEFYSVELTDEKGTDSLNRTIKKFIEQVEVESMHGWRVFDPKDRYIVSSLKNISKT